jgi:hypothetical protein
MVPPGHKTFPRDGFHPVDDRMRFTGLRIDDDITPPDGPPARFGFQNDEIALPQRREHAVSRVDESQMFCDCLGHVFAHS